MLSAQLWQRPAREMGYVAAGKARLMRLCFVADPGSMHTQRWVGYFAAIGHEVHLVNLGPQSERQFDWPGPEHHTLPPSPKLPVPVLRQAARRKTREPVA